MVAGHFATALIAREHAPAGALPFYLVISQLPDLLWQSFHFLGLEPTQPDNPMLMSLDNIYVQSQGRHRAAEAAADGEGQSAGGQGGAGG